MSVNRNVTVPTGSDTSGRTRSTIAGDSRLVLQGCSFNLVHHRGSFVRGRIRCRALTGGGSFGGGHHAGERTPNRTRPRRQWALLCGTFFMVIPDAR
jgi:hypothetical protein